MTEEEYDPNEVIEIDYFEVEPMLDGLIGDTHIVQQCDGQKDVVYELVPLHEMVELFTSHFQSIDPVAKIYKFTVEELYLFFQDKIIGLFVERMMGEMVEKGIVDYKHNGEEFVYSRKKH